MKQQGSVVRRVGITHKKPAKNGGDETVCELKSRGEKCMGNEKLSKKVLSDLIEIKRSLIKTVLI